jgi:RNA polymerase sigma-70 factor (ECF subfamily)
MSKDPEPIRSLPSPHSRSDLPQDLGRSVELAQRASRGDGQALNDLLARYRERVYRLAHIRLRAELRKVVDSEEIVQRTLIVAARKMAGFEVRSHAAIINWLSKIVHNQVRDAADQARAAPDLLPIHSETGASHPPVPIDKGPELGDELCWAELQELYDACVARLPDDMRDAILLRDAASASWEEVALELGRPGAAAARELHRRATVRLRELLRARLKDRLA